MNFFLIKDHHHHWHRNVVEKKNASSKKWQANKTTYRDMQEKLRVEKMYMAKSISHLFRDYGTTTTMDFDSWSIHADSWIWLCALPLGNVLLYTSTFYTFSFCSFSESRMSPCRKRSKKYVWHITWLQVIDLHIKNDYDSVIAFQRLYSEQGRQQRKFHFNVRIDDTFSFLKRNYIATFQTIREWNQSLFVIKNFLLSLSTHIEWRVFSMLTDKIWYPFFHRL